jgi:hypothetical protein
MLRGAQEWVGYRQDAFGDSIAVWNSGPDFAVLRDRWAADPEFVEAMLAHGLLARDPLAAEALTHLDLGSQSRERFSRVLTACLDTQAIGFRLRAVHALHALSCDESWANEVVRVLLGAGFWADRMEAARVAGDFSPSCQIIRALAQAVEDPEYLVRRQAALALLRFAGLSADAELLATLRSGANARQWPVAARQLADRATLLAESH